MEIRDREAECNFDVALETSSLTRLQDATPELALMEPANPTSFLYARTAMTRSCTVIVTSLLDCGLPIDHSPTLSSCAALYHRQSIAALVCLRRGGSSMIRHHHTARASCIDRETQRIQLSSSHARVGLVILNYRCRPWAAWPEHREER